MAEQFQWTIPSNVCASLGALTAGPRNPLSWLSRTGALFQANPPGSGSPASSLNSSDILRDAGILDVQRNVSPTFMRALQILANPGALLSIQQVLAPAVDSLAIYLTNNLADSVAVIQSGEMITMIASAQPNIVFDYISQRAGCSSTQRSTFDSSLSIPEAFAMAASIDCLRKKSGKAFLIEEPYLAAPLKLDEIFMQIQQPVTSRQWLVSCLKKQNPGLISLDELKQASQDLQDKELCSLLPDGILWSQGVASLAETMVIMDQVFELEISRLHRNGQVSQIHQVCFQSSVHDLLMIDLTAQQVRIRASTAQAYVDQVVRFLTEGIHKIPEPVDPAGDVTRQIKPNEPSWELRSLGQGPKISITDSVRIGRSPENQVVLSETSVSRSHCLVEIIDGACWITDLRSSNGTLVNGKRITMPTRLQAKDRVQLGILKYEVIEIRPDAASSISTIAPDR